MIDEALEHLVKGIVDNPAEVVILKKVLAAEQLLKFVFIQKILAK